MSDGDLEVILLRFPNRDRVSHLHNRSRKGKALV